MYKILTINGGGIRGYLTLKVLEEIEKRSNCKISDMFDLIVGTSSGALIGSLLDMPASYISKSLVGSYKDRLFRPNWFSFGGLFNTKYNTKCKEYLIDEIVGDKRFNNYDFAAVSYDMKSSRPVIFNTIEEDETDKYLLTTNFKTCDAIKASSAAPLYWNPFKLNNMLLLDGALVANDPTDVAIRLALGKNYKLEELYIVNITTGNNTREYNMKSGACPLKWTIPMINMLMNSQANATSMLYSNENINYFNLDMPLLHASDNIDDISDENIHALKLDSINLIELHRHDIKKIIKDLCEK